MSAPERSGPPPPQVIPRPATWEPGPDAPWAAIPAERRHGFTLERVAGALATPVEPGLRPVANLEAAVLAALFEEEGETRVILTRRASTLRSHRSEVAFPGGRVDTGETFVQAALREAHEEVGIDPASVDVIGTLSPLTTFSSGAMIRPFIGLLPGRPQVRISPDEVERAFDAALAELLAPGVHHTERWSFGGVERQLHFFDLPGDTVWGATGRMLWELLVRLTGTVPEPGPEDGPLP